MQKPLNPSAIVAAWVFFCVSIAFPPLLIASVPLITWTGIKVVRRYRLVHASCDYYIEERNIINASKLWRAGR